MFEQLSLKNVPRLNQHNTPTLQKGWAPHHWYSCGQREILRINLSFYDWVIWLWHNCHLKCFLSIYFHPERIKFWQKLLTCRIWGIISHQRTGSLFFKSILKQQSGAQMNMETCFSCCNHSSCSYWPLQDPFIMHLQCKWWGTKSTVLLLCKNVFKVYLKLIWSFSV